MVRDDVAPASWQPLQPDVLTSVLPSAVTLKIRVHAAGAAAAVAFDSCRLSTRPNMLNEVSMARAPPNVALRRWNTWPLRENVTCLPATAIAKGSPGAEGVSPPMYWPPRRTSALPPGQNLIATSTSPSDVS